ncbi:MAG: Fic family protein, partial [Candidatus Omnitrophica bacterium]|nr:Fic family protein [Candidatus Omnitrophota bacterium]
VTPATIKLLGKIEAAKDIVEELDIPLSLEQAFRKEASVKTSHYSTKIEGNRLTLRQAKKLLAGEEVVAREIDKREVTNYYDCLEWIHQVSKAKKAVTEKDIKYMHGAIQKGILKGKLRGGYREAQNAIYNSKTRKPAYFPPEAKDVGPLMKSFTAWLNAQHEIHPVLKAGIAHYQFVTIHPFMDGNGRTARALATLTLYREKYDLKRFYSLEEYYAEDLKGYYDALHKCQGVHYYDNPNPDITHWLDYFVKGVSIVFEGVKEKARASVRKGTPQRTDKEIKLLQSLGPRERKILGYFKNNLQLRSKKLCSFFHIRERAARNLITKWLGMGLIERQGTGKKDAYYVLTAVFRQFIGT